MDKSQQTGKSKRKHEDNPETSQGTQVRSKRLKNKDSASTSKSDESENTISREEYHGRLKDFEKIDLFKGLITHGSSDLSILQKYVPNKSVESIKRFLYTQRRVGQCNITDGKDKAPIDKWLEFLILSFGNDKERLLDLSRALKYMALFEPRGKENESLLSDCYKLLSDCMKGETPKHLDPVTSLFLHGEMQKLIRFWKQGNFDREINHLETFEKKKTICYSGKKKSPEEQIDNSISNPLKIPDSLLELKK